MPADIQGRGDGTPGTEREAPYVRLYMARSQAKLIEELLAREVDKRGPTSRYVHALKAVRREMFDA